MKKVIFAVCALLPALLNAVAGDTLPRSTSTRSTAEAMMRAAAPALELDTTVSPEGFALWRERMGQEMARIMKHPAAPAAPPVKVAQAKRDGYRIERWISYPLLECAVAYYVLVPDGVTESNPAPAVLCVPGFGQTKELVAVAVDNPSCGELSDNGVADYVTSSRFLLELGWSYLGLASWQDKVVLDWMKTQPQVRADRILVSGFSLGTEPLMVLGLLDDSIYAFVYNDFLCRTRERALVMNKPNKNGVRAFPNNDEHLIPEFLTLFDFPDIVAALAPRPVICTEGGMDRDFKIISKAYEIAGAPQNFEYHHYARYADPSSRQYLDSLPSGIDRDEFFRLANVDSQNHYFKLEWVMPWLKRVISRE